MNFEFCFEHSQNLGCVSRGRRLEVCEKNLPFPGPGHQVGLEPRLRLARERGWALQFGMRGYCGSQHHPHKYSYVADKVLSSVGTKTKALGVKRPVLRSSA